MKKILIITYYWPPSGGGGVQRWLKFAKYLPHFGWEPIIYTPENPDFELKDDTLLKDVNPDLEVLKMPIWEPYQYFQKLNKGKKMQQGLLASDSKPSLFTKIALFIRGNFFIPDPRKYWVKPSVSFLTNIIKDNSIDIVVTTGPPHSMHLIGLALKMKMDIKWVADFRDPWSRWDMLDQFMLTWLAKWKHKQLEKKVLKTADAILTVSTTWAQEFEQIHPRKYTVITNGYDKTDFDKQIAPSKNEKFVISHFGLINSFRNPAIFWEALSVIASKRNIEVRLFGTIEPQIIKQVKGDAQLSKIVVFKRALPHDEVLQAYQQSDALLLLLNNSENADGHIPGKLFEYMASNRPIIALGPPSGDAATILKDTATGTTVGWRDQAKLEETLLQMIDRMQDYKPNQALLEKYSREALTQQLVDKVLQKLQ